MARILIFTRTPYREVIGVDASVGLGCQNTRDDVMAVQYLLRVASEKAADSRSFQPPGEDPIGIDGIIGPQTQRYISFFQQEVNRRQKLKMIEPDGRIDTVRSGSSTTSITQTFYTILALNSALRSRRADQFRLENDSLIPTDLKLKLFVF